MLSFLRNITCCQIIPEQNCNSTKEERKRKYQHKTEASSINHILSSKSKNYYIFWVCIYSLIYQARKAHAPYYIVIYGPWDCATSHKRHHFWGEKKLLNMKCASWFFLRIYSVKFLILRRIQKDISVNLRTSSGAYVGGERCAHGSAGETWRKETTGETQT
jgi:hypothetical protein